MAAVVVTEAAVIKQPKASASAVHKKLPTANKHYQALMRPTRCFCQLAENELIYWARLHFTDGVPTQDLLHRTDDADQQEAIIVVALLGLEDHVLLEQMRRVALPFTHILQCRTNTRRLLGLSLKTDQGLDDIFN